MFRIPAPLIAAALLPAFALPAQAAVTCSASRVVAPAYPQGVPANNRSVDAVGSVEVTCDRTQDAAAHLAAPAALKVTVAFSAGLSGDYSIRRLGRNGPLYNLYVDPGRTQIWGDPLMAGGTFARELLFDFRGGTLTTQTLSAPVYGSARTPSGTPAGNDYTDIVQVSVRY